MSDFDDDSFSTNNELNEELLAQFESYQQAEAAKGFEFNAEYTGSHYVRQYTLPAS